MDIPEAFRRFGGLFYQRGYEDFASIDAWIAHNFNAGPAPERAVLKNFLGELLSGRYSDQELADIWRSTNPDLDFKLGYHRNFLKKVRDMMDK